MSPAGQARPVLLLATGNPGKVRELRALLAGLPLRILAPADLPGLRLAPESGRTLEEIAAAKARQAAVQARVPALADDTGLFVAGLGGGPGVRTARYAGEPADDEANRARLLAALAGTPPAARRAVFRTVVALAFPDGQVLTAAGSRRGRITEGERGSHGFGYDAVFEVAGTGKTYAEMTPDEKNRLSHRAVALARARRLIEEYLLAPGGPAGDG